MSNESYKNYVCDLGLLLKEKALDAKKIKDKSNGGERSDYDIGYLMAFNEVISLMQQQAEAFNIDPNEIGLGKIDPDLELL